MVPAKDIGFTGGMYGHIKTGMEVIRKSIKPGTVLRTLVLTMTMAVVSISCSFRHNNYQKGPSRTVLVYMAGDNNLSGKINSNINGIMAGMTSSLTYKHNMLVYADRPSVGAFLLKVTETSVDTLIRYGIQDSASPSVMAKVIADACLFCPAENYGLVLWSHGTGWIPSSMHANVDPYKLVAKKSMLRYSAAPSVLDDIERVPFRTKAFGIDQTADNSWIDLDEMLEAIPQHVFDYIAFDACYMASAELAYAFRNHTEYIIASAVEILADGFPYYEMVEGLLQAECVTVAREYYEFYNAKSGVQKSAGIAVIKTDKLDSLTLAVKDVVRTAQIPATDLMYGDVKVLDRYHNHVMFDLEDMVEKMQPSEEALENFRYALEKCVIYHASTEMMVNELSLDKYCGLNAFVPFTRYTNTINPYFLDTEWNKATGLLTE